MTPLAKVSDTLLEFALPLLEDLPTRPTPDKVEKILKIASLGWNVAIEPELARTLPDAEDPADPENPEVLAFKILANLALRKLALYRNDRRLIVLDAVRPGLPGELRISAQATYANLVSPPPGR